jgi:hypothetical protein
MAQHPGPQVECERLRGLARQGLFAPGQIAGAWQQLCATLTQHK